MLYTYVTGFNKTRLQHSEIHLAISRNNCIIASWWIALKKWNLQQVLVYSLAIIVWVNNFQTPKIQAFLSSFEGNDIARGSKIGVVGGDGLNIGV